MNHHQPEKTSCHVLFNELGSAGLGTVPSLQQYKRPQLQIPPAQQYLCAAQPLLCITPVFVLLFQKFNCA